MCPAPDGQPAVTPVIRAIVRFLRRKRSASRLISEEAWLGTFPAEGEHILGGVTQRTRTPSSFKNVTNQVRVSR